MNSPKYKFIFFGTPEISRIILEKLNSCGFTPSLVVCSPDKPKGRGLELSAPETKKWAESNGVNVFQPKKLDDEAFNKITESGPWDFFVVAAYGKIIPQRFLDIPQKGSINVHPSLLPKYRGPSPLQAQILSGEDEVGTTIMLMDALMDHGPILSQKKLNVLSAQPFSKFLEEMAKESAELLCEVLPKYLSGEIIPAKQNEAEATVCKMIKKEDGLIDPSGDPLENYRKYLALNPWPGIYFFLKKNGSPIRIKVSAATFEDGQFVIKKIVPEGKHEMDYEDFKRNL